jgi:hypothetical protein
MALFLIHFKTQHIDIDHAINYYFEFRDWPFAQIYSPFTFLVLPL